MRTTWLSLLLSLAATTACSDVPEDDFIAEDSTGINPTELGPVANRNQDKIRFRVFAGRASRLELDIFARASGEEARLRLPMTKLASSAGVWTVTVNKADLARAGITSVYYGYRAWGPNWVYDARWQPGSLQGFVADVDAEGNRFNPNKLLLDPYAREMSHDPVTPSQLDGSAYGTGPVHRTQDTARIAPKGIVVGSAPARVGTRPTRAFKDEVIYEVHLRGLTKGDTSLSAAERGTYKAAGAKAAYLKSIGVTAVEFLPLQETQNDANPDNKTDGANYWGYMTLSYFAPDRRYAFDTSPGGPTREFQEMVAAFHREGIKVYVDVVYNHTGEGGVWDQTGDVAGLYSFRGLDNREYYLLTADKRFNYDNTGVGGNFNVASPRARDLIIDSLAYWHNELGVDGFRFDLASVLGNRCEVGCFEFDKLDPNNALNRAVRQLPARDGAGGKGVDLIAEPWAIGGGTYQVGNFPSGWAEWNGSFRDTFRKDQNQLGQESVTPGQLAARFAGSSDLYQDDGRKPWHSVNFLAAHDGFSLRDLYAYNQKRNNQPWPYGPSDGGEDHNASWDQSGDVAAQRQAARTGLALVMLSAGVPMITGGDEFYRTQYGNNNAYNLDSAANWLDYNDQNRHQAFYTFSQRLMAFRGAHPALRPAEFFSGADRNGDGVKAITWYQANGAEADGSYMASTNEHYLAYRIDGSEVGDSAASILVLYNGWSGPISATVPEARPGKNWHIVSDTARWMEADSNFRAAGTETRLDSREYGVAGRSVVLLLEQ
jgi:isoamylase